MAKRFALWFEGDPSLRGGARRLTMPAMHTTLFGVRLLRTHTQMQRYVNPTKFERKDARTKILRTVYGQRNAWGKRDEVKFTSHEDFDSAKMEVIRLMPKTRWPEEKRLEVLADLHALKPKQTTVVLA